MIQNLKGTNLFSQKKKKKKKFEREKSKKIKKHIILAKRPKKKKEKTSCSKLRGFETGMKWIGFGLNEPTGAHTRLKWFTPPN